MQSLFYLNKDSKSKGITAFNNFILHYLLNRNVATFHTMDFADKIVTLP